ncbi:hypothetical protein DRP04_03310 [Archaeoglobales archaeon]|nr:MAG: hypothetical protein DRP04_03310 [Archaeoglobales archaeon]
MSADRLIKLLSTAFRKDPDSNNYRLISIIADRFDELENVLEDVRKSHFVETAQGISLDYIAKLFNMHRKEESDDDFRTRIQAKIRTCLSCGTKSDIFFAVTYFNAISEQEVPVNVFILEPEPAHFIVVVPVLNTYDLELKEKLYSKPFRAWFKNALQFIVNKVKAAGVLGEVIILAPESIVDVMPGIFKSYGLPTTWQGLSIENPTNNSAKASGLALSAESDANLNTQQESCVNSATTWQGTSVGSITTGTATSIAIVS